MRLGTLVLRNIFRRRTRSILTITGVSVAVGAMVALVGIAKGFEQSLLAVFRGRGVDVVVTRSGGLQRSNSFLSESLGERIRAIPGVREVSAGLAQPLSFEERDMFGVMVRGVPPDSFLLRDLNIASGRSLQAGDVRQALLGKLLATNLGKQVGEKFDVVPRRIVRGGRRLRQRQRVRERVDVRAAPRVPADHGAEGGSERLHHHFRPTGQAVVGRTVCPHQGLGPELSTRWPPRNSSRRQSKSAWPGPRHGCRRPSP